MNSGTPVKQAKFLSLGLLLVATSYPAIAQAQAPIDGGALRQQIEREREQSIPQRGADTPETTLPRGNAESSGKLNITVSAFNFEGNSLLSDSELTAAVASYLNRPVSFADLQGAATAVGEAYRAKGWIVRTFLPQQDIVGGVVTIQIIEAKFGQTHIESDADSWLTQEKAAAMVKAQQNGGEVMNTAQMDRAILLMDDLPGVAAAGRLQQGKSAGETDLVVKLTEESMLTGFAAIDNQGARTTGYGRVHGNLQLASPLGMGDLTSLYLLASRGMRYAQFEQSFPVGNDGLRISANASIMDYRVIPSEFYALDGEGDSISLGAKATYPLIRARKQNLYTDVSYDHRRFTNDANGATSSDYNTDSVTAILHGNIFDDFAGGGITTASIGAVAGRLDQGTLNAGEDPDLDDGYRKVVYKAARQQTVTDDVSLYASVSGQLSPDRKLDSSEMFYLGGPYGVRAYPVSEGSGVEGTLANLELRWRFMPGFQLAGFYDHGHVKNHGAAKSYSLKGAGLALGWQPLSGLNMDATWSHRIGDNPNPAADGDDQDGSDVKNRFWLSLSKQF